METRVPADDAGWPPPSAMHLAGREPDAIELRLAAIEDRLESLERSLRDAVAEELQGATDELRRVVSDLGRLLLRDLDRLTKVLAEHRDAIVDRVVAATAGTHLAKGETEVTEALQPPEAEAEVEAEPKPLAGEDGRWRALPGRRRRRS